MTGPVRRLMTALTLTGYVLVNVMAAALHHHDHGAGGRDAAVSAADRLVPHVGDGDDDDDADCSLCAVIHAGKDVSTPVRPDFTAEPAGAAVPVLPNFSSHPFPLPCRSRAPPFDLT